jgi:hypothetical protein
MTRLRATFYHWGTKCFTAGTQTPPRAIPVCDGSRHSSGLPGFFEFKVEFDF